MESKTTTTEQFLKCMLTDEEIRAQAERLAEAQQERDRLDEELKSVKKQYQGKIDEQASIMTQAGDLIRCKYEMRMVKVERTIDYDNGVVTFTRTDTGEVFKTRPIKDEERQVEMKLTEDVDAPFEEPVQTQDGGPATPSEKKVVEIDQLTEAHKLITKTGRATVTTLQRGMSVGYTAATRIMDELERLGLVSGPDSEGVRTLLIEHQFDDDQAEEQEESEADGE